MLPFENMSGDPEQEYFSDGITEDIITDLSKIAGLLVIARNSSFVYKGRRVSLREVGREFGVRHVLEGSVRKAGGRVRITAQLIDTSNDSHVRAERYDGALDDIFALQDEVSAEVVRALEIRLTAAEVAAPASRTEHNVEAYDHLLRARQYLFRFAPEANAVARAALAERSRSRPTMPRRSQHSPIAISRSGFWAGAGTRRPSKRPRATPTRRWRWMIAWRPAISRSPMSRSGSAGTTRQSPRSIARSRSSPTARGSMGCGRIS